MRPSLFAAGRRRRMRPADDDVETFANKPRSTAASRSQNPPGTPTAFRAGDLGHDHPDVSPDAGDLKFIAVVAPGEKGAATSNEVFRLRKIRYKFSRP